jgi:hypothetical protein
VLLQWLLRVCREYLFGSFDKANAKPNFMYIIICRFLLLVD